MHDRMLFAGQAQVSCLVRGPQNGEDSWSNLFRVAGFECVSYGLRNGQHFDLVDDSVWDPLWAAVVAREYAAGFACPDCASFSKLHYLPGPPPLRDAVGRGRYGRGDLTFALANTVREQTP